MNFSIWKYINKSKLLIAMELLLFCIPFGFALFFTKLGMTGFSLLHTIVRFNFYVCFFVVIISFYVISSANRYGYKEVSEAIAGKAIYENSALIYISSLLFIWNIGMCIILIVCSNMNDGSSFFLRWFPLNYVCNITIPQLICIFLTYIISYSENASRWIMSEIGFLFLISPFSEEIVWTRKPDFPIDAIWNAFRWPFAILYQNGEWSPDVQNDFQLEKVRLLVLLFWIILLLGLSILTVYKKRMGIVFVLCSFIVLAVSYHSSSLYRLNSSWNGSKADYWYYDVENKNLNYEPTETMNYRITDYDFEVSFDYELSVSGDIHMSSDEKRDEFHMTLYHGYNVNKLSPLDLDTKIQFSQQGDDINIKVNKPVDDLNLHIEYAGHHNKFYSNSRGALLPGFFPWYPMVGEKQIFLKYGEYGDMYGYNPYNRVAMTHFILRTNQKIITNLSRVDAGMYEGDSDGITVLMGNISDCVDPLICDYLPLSLYKGYNKEAFVNEQKQSYIESLNKLKDFYGIDVSELEKKKILFASKDIGRNYTNNFFAVFGDYILAAPGYITCDSILHYLILRDSENRGTRENAAIIKLFIMSNFDDTPEVIAEELLEKLKYRKDNEDEYSGKIEDIEDWITVISKTDRTYFVRNMVQFIMNPMLYGDERDFLNKMREGL